MENKPSALEMLKNAHTFPGPYIIKAIGENSPDFVAHVVQAVIVVLGPTSTPEVQTRQSAQGKHQAVTMTLQVESAEQVLQLYEAVKKVKGLRFLL